MRASGEDYHDHCCSVPWSNAGDEPRACGIFVLIKQAAYTLEESLHFVLSPVTDSL